MKNQKNKQEYIANFERTDRFGSLMGAKIISLSSDECIFEYTVSSNHYNPNGILHGGALFGIMDSSQGLFVHYILGDTYSGAVTGTATVKYLAPVREGIIRIRTFLKEHQGRKLFVNSVATNVEGNEVAVLEEIWISILKK